MAKKTVTNLKDLNLVDKFLFDETMESREAYEAAVSILLENEVELLGNTQTEKELRISPQLRQVRLDDSCFILIAPFDIFGKGLCRYTFEGSCRECPDLKLGDGAVRVFINTKGRNREDFSEEFLDFMEYVMDLKQRRNLSQNMTVGKYIKSCMKDRNLRMKERNNSSAFCGREVLRNC